MKIKTGDKVRITAGKDKGKEGKVIQIFPKVERVIVEDLNKATRHLRGQGSQPGQKIEYSSPIHVSNVILLSPKTSKTGRVGYKFIEKDGVKTKIRILQKKGSSEDIE